MLSKPVFEERKDMIRRNLKMLFLEEKKTRNFHRKANNTLQVIIRRIHRINKIRL